MATVGISVLSAPYANSVHSSPKCHALSGYQITTHHRSTASPSLSQPENPTLLERGGARPCPSEPGLSSHRDARVPMSHVRSFSDSSNDALLASGPAATAPTETIKSPASKKRKAPADSRSPEPEASGRRRPASWHPSGPVEPRLAPTQLPPIAVPSILNPAHGAAPVDSSRDASGTQQMSRPRLPSSPTPRLVHPSMAQPVKRLSLSPGPKQRPLMAPVSPSARFMGTAGGYSGKQSTAYHSPLVHESQPVSYSTPGSPQPTHDPAVVSSSSTAPPVGGPPPSTSVQSTPTFHSRRISAGPTPNLSPQETSPSTPQSIYSQFGRSSPALTGISGPPSMPSILHSSPYGAAEPGRFPPVAGSQRYPAEGSHSGMSNAQADPNADTQPGMIPCTLDLKSGSSTQAEKRKANSDASRRFRNRKRNEVQMEQKITAQQEEMRKQADALHQRAQEIRTMTQQCEYYRSERDYYREHLSRVLPPSQLPSRPISPQALSSSSSSSMEKPTDHANESVWKQSAMPATTLPAPASLPPATTMTPARVSTTWTTAPSAYSTAPSASTVSDEQPSRSLPQPSWTRT